MPEILKTKRKKSKEQKRIITYLICALKGLALSLLGLGLISIVLLNNASFSAFYKAILYIVIALGGALSGFCAYRKLKGRGIINGAICSAVFGIILTLFLLIIMRFSVGVNIIYILPLSIISGVVGGILGANL